MPKRRDRFFATDGKLTIVLKPGEKGGFIVTSPFTPGMAAQSKTLEEAFAKAHETWTSMENAGRDQARIPPQSRPKKPRQLASKKKMSTVKS